MAQQKTRTFLLGRFEAGDRPTDQDFANLFESILFLNNDLSGHNNGLATDNTSIEGNFEIGGTLDLIGNFKMGAKLSVGNTTETLQSPISAYNSDNFAVYYASSSLSDIMFEGVSQDVTSTIKLTETLAGSTPAVPSTNTLIFGTSAGRVFLQNDGQEILHMTSSGHNGSSPQVYISGSVGIGSGWDSGTAATGEQLHIQALGEGDATMRLTSDGTDNDSIIKLRQSDNVGFDLIYDGGIDKFQIKENSGKLPFQIEHGASTNTLYLDSSGMVGIGLSNPSEKLHVKGTTAKLGIKVETTTGHAILDMTTTNSTFSWQSRGTNNGLYLVDGTGTVTPFKILGGNPTNTLVLDGNGRIGIKTDTPEATLHIIGDPEGLIPMMLIEGGGNILEQDILILRDLGTADGNLNNVKFQATSGEHNIAQIQVKTKGSNASSGGSMNIFTYSDDSDTANTNQLYLKNDGKIGIGTDTPDETLDVQGVINSTSEFSAVNPDDEGEYRLGSRTDFGLKGTNYSAQLQAPNSVYVMIDSNADDDGSKFKIQKHSSTVGGGTTLFTVDQSGGVTGSAFVGDGSQLTNLSGQNFTGFVSTPGEDYIVTTNAAGDAIYGEGNLTFDGSTLAFTSTTAPAYGYISFPLLDDTQGEIFRTALRFPSTDDRALLQYGTVGDDDFELRLRLQDSNADKFVIISDATSDYRALDINGERALFFSDNSAGKVGIGVTPTATLHAKSTAASSVAGLFEGAEDGILHVNAGSGGTTADNDAVIRLQRQGNNKWGIITKADTGLRIYDYDSSIDHTFFETGGNVGIGTTDPTVKLDVNGIIHAVDLIQIEGIDDNTAPGTDYGKMSGYGIMGNRSAYYITNTNASGVIRFGIGGVHNTNTKMSILSDGNVGIGVTSPTAQLHVGSTRPIKIGAGAVPGSPSIEGSISSQGQSGGWANSFRFIGSSNTDHGGFYGHGSGDTFNKWGIAPAYDNDAGLHVVSEGNGATTVAVGIGTTAPSTNLHIKSELDAAIWLEADTDNDALGEDHNAFIKLTQDNQGVIGYLGLVGSANFNPEGDSSTNTLQNSLYLGTKTADAVQLVTSNVARLTVTSGGNIGIGDKSPAETLVVNSGDSDLISRFHSTSNEDKVKGIRINSKDAAGDQIYMDLAVDPKNQKVGIGIGTNGGSLPIGDTDLDQAEIVIESTGNVGIGTSSPTTKLHVYAGSTLDNDILFLDGIGSGFGTGTAGLNEKHSSLTIRSSGATAADKISQLNLKVDSTNLWQLLTDNNDSNRFHIQHNNDDSDRFITVETGGLVGIGVTNPAYALDVAGSVMSATGADSGRFLMGGRTDLGTISDNYDIQIQAPGHVIAMIDSNDNDTDHSFKVKIHSETVDGGTERFRVQQDGLVYINDGMYIQSSTGLSGLADSVFAGESGTLRRHLFYFPAAAGSNDPGRIEHLTSTTQTNAAVIRLVPSDDQGTQDYVTICGSDEPEMIRLFTTGEGHFRGGLGVGELWNQVGNDISAGTHVNGSQIADGVIDIKSNADAGIFLRADVDNSTESHNAFIEMTQDGTYVGGIIGLGESATVGPRGDTIRFGTDNAMYMYSSDSFLDTDSNPADLHLGAGSTMALTITDKLGDEDVGVIIGPETTHYKYGSDTYPALSIKMKTQATMTLSTTCTNVQTNSEHGGGLALIDNDTNKSAHIELFNGTDLLFGFRSNTSAAKVKVRGYIRHDVNLGAITFTGQHKNVPETGVADDYIHHVGKIVISKGTYKNLNLDQISDKPNINEALPKVALSAQLNDKRVWGVISNAEDSSESKRTDAVGAFVSIYPKQDNRIIVNSVGEGGILVSNYNGDLENGDYITTCPLEGLGMKQDDDLLHNYTVAKITQDCDFTSDTTDVTHDGQTYKYKFVGCTYHCG